MSGDVLKFHVEINDDKLQRVLANIADEATMTEIHNLFAKTIDPWVPYLEGPLSQTLEITPEYVQYKQPYAHYQYYGEGFNHTTDYHPLASAKWDQAAMQTQRESFLEQVKQILQRRQQELWQQTRTNQ